jgi:hypothetical protein
MIESPRRGKGGSPRAVLEKMWVKLSTQAKVPRQNQLLRRCAVLTLKGDESTRGSQCDRFVTGNYQFSNQQTTEIAYGLPWIL